MYMEPVSIWVQQAASSQVGQKVNNCYNCNLVVIIPKKWSFTIIIYFYLFVEKVLYKNISSAQNAEFHMVHLERRTFREKVLPQQWGLLLEWWSPSSSSSRLRLDSVDRPCGDVSVTGTASRAARKSRCAVLKVVIRDYKCQYWYGLLKMTLSWFWRLQNGDKTRKFKKRRSQDLKNWSSWSCSCLWSC